MKEITQMITEIISTMPDEYQKIFLIVLSALQSQKSNVVVINKKEFFDLVGATDPNRHARCRKMWQNLMVMTDCTFKKDKLTIICSIITKVRSTEKEYRIYVDSEIYPYLLNMQL